MYRDDAEAARARLVSLERELCERRALRPTLTAYRAALREELQRLEHARTWYRNGERHGWNRFPMRDDLSPASPPPAQVPTPAQLATSLRGIDPQIALARAEGVERKLAHSDPALLRLEIEVSELQRRCAWVRAEVEEYARRYPDHPPPPEYKVGAALAIAGATFGGFLALIAALVCL